MFATCKSCETRVDASLLVSRFYQFSSAGNALMELLTLLT